MSEIRVTDPVTGGQKGAKPERYGLIPWDALGLVARVFAFGARKYSDFNWRKGYDWRLSYDAMMRHLALWIEGEDDDLESNLPHLAHVAWHCLVLMWFALHEKGADTRAANNPEYDSYESERT